MHVWKVAERADAEMDGWRPVVCHRDRQRSIIYGGKSCACFASVSHVKAYISDFSSRLALSLSLLQITHGDIFRGEKKKKILKVRNVSLTYFRNLYAVRDGDVTASRLCSICGRRRHQRCIICSTFVDFRVAVCDSSSQVTFVREVYF